MSCPCTSYTCLEAFINPCSEGVDIGLAATYSGNMTIRVWFNGVVRTAGVGVTQNDNIIIPRELLNENYVHELRIYNMDDLLGCYHLKTQLDYNSPEYPVPPINDSDMQGKEYTGNETATQIFAELDGKQLLTIAMNGQEYTSDFWTQTGTGVTWDDPYMIFTGTIVLNWINA